MLREYILSSRDVLSGVDPRKIVQGTGVVKLNVTCRPHAYLAIPMSPAACIGDSLIWFLPTPTLAPPMSIVTYRKQKMTHHIMWMPDR